MRRRRRDRKRLEEAEDQGGKAEGDVQKADTENVDALVIHIGQISDPRHGLRFDQQRNATDNNTENANARVGCTGVISDPCHGLRFDHPRYATDNSFSELENSPQTEYILGLLIL